MNLKPLRDRILIQFPPADAEQKSEGGIIIGRTADPQQQTAIGIVVAVGSDVTDVEVGQDVLVGKYSGADVKHDGQAYRNLSVLDVLAVVEA